MEKECLLGAHASAAGGVHHALEEGKKFGATTIQLFTSNQRQWKSKPLEQTQIDLWKKTKEETGLKEIMSHDSYLINLGSCKDEVLQKSLVAFRDELVRCHQLDISYLNFHPGAAVGDDPQNCLDRIIESLLSFEELASQGSTILLLEATAGQGSTMGYLFEQLKYIIDGVVGKIPIGVCIDTCHIFAAGYDLRTFEACDETIRTFDEVVGLEYLKAFHLNDSLKDVGSRVDRHRPLGEGCIGMDCFRFLMTDPRTRYLPKYLETPGGPPLWEKEIIELRKFAKLGYKHAHKD